MTCSSITRAFFAGALSVIIFTLAGCNQQSPANAGPSHTNSLPPANAELPAVSQTANTVIPRFGPLRTIASLTHHEPGGPADFAVHIQGQVLDERPGEYIVVHDDTGTVFAETRQTDLTQVKETVDVQGEPVVEGSSISLKDTVIVGLPGSNNVSQTVSTSAEKPPNATLPILTNAWQVRDLPAAQAAWHYPVSLHAVVTVNASFQHYFFAQDDTSGITVLSHNVATNVSPKPGDLVEIDGTSDPGGFSPIVTATNVTILGQSELPAPRPETLFQLATGQDGIQWIEVRGVVHAASYTNGLARLDLNDPSGMIAVRVPADHAPVELLDSLVRIRGACGSTSNPRRQLIGVQLWVSSLDDIQVEELGVADPLSLPALPIASLSGFHPRQTMQHRVNVAGQVTFCDASSFYIQDANDGVRVLSSGPTKPKPGDYVMAAGYPGMEEYGPLLRSSVYKVIGHGEVPAPETVLPAHNLDRSLHDRWVQIRALFLRRTVMDTSDILTLQTGDRIFEVHCLMPLPPRVKKLEPDSLLRIVGVYRVLADDARVPRSFQVTVTSPDQIEILAEPSWWTFKHTANVIGAMTLVTLVAALWVLMLRRKVREQTASLQESERQFRSLVEQSLVGVYFVQDGNFIYVNPRMAAIFGYTPEELVQSVSVESLIVSEDLPMVREQVRRRIDDEIDFSHYTFRGRRKDGAIIHAEVLGNRAELHGKPAVLGMLLDVTERQVAQDKIAEQARLLDLASDAIVVFDLSDRILYWNQNAQRIYGTAVREAVGGIAYEQMLMPVTEFQTAKQNLLAGHKWHGEYKLRNREGQDITMETRWTLVHDVHGKPGSILAINVDITQQKKLETQFLRAQRL